MVRRVEKIDDQVLAAIDRIIRARMAPWGYTGLRVRAGLDWMGDPVLFIDVDYKLMEQPLDPRVTFGLVTDVLAAIEDLGEERFPHISHHFHEDQTTTQDT